jgi:O-antigen/teichoic acid export membrane protein
LAGMVNEVADKIMMRHLLPDPSTAESQLGIYGANYKLAVLMMIFIQMFRYAFEPFFFAEEKKKDSRVTYARVMVWFVIFASMIFLLVSLYLDLFKYFVGPAFREGLIIVPIILAAKMFLGIFYNLSVWYKLTNKTLYGAAIAILGALITIGLNIYLIPRLGYVGAAWTNFVAYFTMMTVSYFWGQKVYPVPYDMKRISLYLIFAAILFFISKLLQISDQTIRLMLNSVLILLFVGLVYLKEIRKYKPETSPVEKKEEGGMQ